MEGGFCFKKTATYGPPFYTNLARAAHEKRAYISLVHVSDGRL